MPLSHYELLASLAALLQFAVQVAANAPLVAAIGDLARQSGRRQLHSVSVALQAAHSLARDVRVLNDDCEGAVISSSA